MIKKSRKLIAIGIGTILLPILLFLLYDISKLQEDERILAEIYLNQLDFVIFSANQFSNDYAENLIDYIEKDFNEGKGVSEKTKGLLYSSGCSFFNIKSIDEEVDLFSFSIEENPQTSMGVYQRSIEKIHEESNDLIQQLTEYRRTGYRKIEPHTMSTFGGSEFQVLYAILLDLDERPHILTALIEPNSFVTEILSPKLQQIAQEDVVISLLNQKKDSLIFSTEEAPEEIIASKNMWLFPSLELGISLKGKSLSQITGDRIRLNLIATGALLLLMILGIAMIARNINHQMKLAQTKSDFVSNVSHELRTPLALISMFAETLMLNRVKTEEKKYEYFEIIYKETSRLSKIVNRILNFSKIEANRKKYHFENINVDSVISELVRDYSFHLESNGFEYKFSKNGTLPQIQADKEAIYEVLVNLIDNAIKYSKDTKYIELKTGLEQDSVTISVSDKGIGIPRDNQKQIFDKFFRVSEGNVHTVQGAGLGLSLVSSIMEAHHGHVAVESKLGEGSTFKLFFPIKPQEDV